MHYQTFSLIMDAVRNFPRTVYNLMGWSQSNPRDYNSSIMRNFVLSMSQSDTETFRSECDFVRNIPLSRINEIYLPYKTRLGFEDFYDKFQVVHGRENGLPYILHENNKKVFFPVGTTVHAMIENYKCLLLREGITGKGILEASPHCYQDDDFFVENGDCVLDIGCAEALFAIDNIDKAKKVYLFECERFWQKPLKATFSQYADKVCITKKTVSSVTSKIATRLSDVVAKDGALEDRYFVKMDIEGGEKEVISGNADFLRQNKVKLSCCVYHNQEDAALIKNMLEKIGYETRFSKGYMLCDMNGVHFPYFRHGVIYARNY